ncbi:acyl-CoA dehydrogenase [Nocardia panacis]|uniref:Acyl-CoA dehydrogenase n=1 Tax=Nocardia panacis TaxID=2340916 RepID=A0A3A4K4N9_9NOCA|nr:acyl-CoA dehydrogenase family protein [Nocardia panacis]RJO69224.1 acyl-CoA dehydrogenase [Nocardia panacis]
MSAEFRETVRAALAEIVLPYADQWERQGRMDRAAWLELGARGLLHAGLTGTDFLCGAIVLEELGRTGYAGVRAAVAVHAFMAAYYLERFATPEQRHYLEDLRAGRLIVGLAISEPEAGSDLRTLTTVARENCDAPTEYLVSGTKSPIANGLDADILITLANTATRPTSNALACSSLLIVDLRDAPVTRTPLPMLGWHSAGLATIEFAEVGVPAGNLLGRRDRAMLHLMAALDFERLAASLLALGGVGHCLELTLAQVRARVIDADPLVARQAIRHRLTALTGELSVLTTYLDRAVRSHAIGELDTYTAATAKLMSTELAAAAARACLQFHGARGYRADAAPARIYRDAAGAILAAGPSELMHELMFTGIDEALNTYGPSPA